MKKGKIKIIEKLKAQSLPDIYIRYIESLEFPIYQLEIVADYILANYKTYSYEDIMQEIQYACELDVSGMSKSMLWKNIRICILPRYFTDILMHDQIKGAIFREVINDTISSYSIVDALFTVQDSEIRRYFWENRERLCDNKNFGLCDLVYKPCMLSDINRNGIQSFAMQLFTNHIILPNSIYYSIKNFLEYILNKYEYVDLSIFNFQLDESNTVIGYDFRSTLTRDIENAMKLFTFDCKCEQSESKVSFRYIQDWGNVKKFIQLMNETEIEVTINVCCYNLYLEFRDGFIYISGNKYHRCYYDIQRHTLLPSNRIMSFQFMITPTGIILETKYGKNFPASVKRLIDVMDNHFLLQELVKHISKILSKRYFFLKDVINDIRETRSMIAPMKVNDLFIYHTRSEYLCKNYKATMGIKLKWNKINVSCSYLFLKCVCYVDNPIFLAQHLDLKYVMKLHAAGKKPIRKWIIPFLANIISDNIAQHSNITADSDVMPAELSEIYVAEAQDYVKMCLETKQPIHLNIKLESQLVNAHDHITRRFDNNGIGNVAVPKDSRFNTLRKWLPKEYVWIKTRRRLIMEANIQHHCVASYYDKINADDCAIYTYYDKTGEYSLKRLPRRYTIEFIIKNNKYVVNQTQGQYDAVNASLLTDHLRNVLAEHQKE